MTASITTKLGMAALDVTSGSLLYRGTPLAALIKAGVPAAAILAAAKAWLADEVDRVAEALRLSVLTPGTGQSMEYQEVSAEAAAALADPADATAAKYPMLAATIGVDVDPSTKTPATDVLGVARAVQAQSAAWTVLGAAIRAARMKGKAVIDATPDVATAVAAFDAITWPAVPGA